MTSSSIFQRLAVLGLPPDAMREVLSIIAEIKAGHEAIEVKTLARRSRDRARKFRGKSVESVTENPPKEKNQTPNPVANATAHEALTDLVWKTFLPRLIALGTPERSARSNVGRWLKDAGPERTMKAIDAAERVGTGDPIPYITAALKTDRARKNGTGWYIKQGSEEWEAWKRHALKISDGPLLGKLKYVAEGADIQVSSRWPK